MIGRRRWLVPASLPLLIVLVAAVAVGCGGGPAGVLGGGDAPNEASLGGAYVPAGFGEGSLWATDIFTCDDTSVLPFGGGSAACGFGGTAQLLKRLDPETGEEEAAIPLGGFFATTTEVAFGAGSAWVSSTGYGPGPAEERQPYDAVYRIDPKTNRVVDRVPVDPPSGVDFGFGSAWAVSAGHGTLSRIDPETGEAAASIRVGRGAVDVAVDEESGAVWVAGLYLPEDPDGGDPREDPGARKLSRVDPRTMRVAAEVPIRADSPHGGSEAVAVGEGAVWVASVDGRLLKVDPATDRVVAVVPLGAYASDLEVSGGSVWVTGQNHSGWLKRVDPRGVEVVWTKGLGAVDNGGYGSLAADGATGRVFFVEGGWRAGKKGTLTRVSP